MLDTDVLIIGCGIAGATAALMLAQNPGRHITVITRDSNPCESNTRYAQGGIVARGQDDNAELLAKDILEAGAGASDPQAVELLAREGPDIVQEILIEMAGIRFDSQSNGEYEFGREGAHSRRRILHVGDGTGQAIINGLVAAIQKYPNISILTNTTAVDLITFPHHSRNPLEAYRPVICHGAYAFDRNERTVHRYMSAVTILATEG